MRIAVVLFNLGGPDCPEAVQPFLFNLFNDPAIIRLPGLLRWPLGQLISRRRAPVAREIYAELGGRSPIGELTEQQAAALEAALRSDSSDDVKCFIAMRYWHPRAQEAAEKVKRFGPEKIVLLPLYPQYSTTTTGSSLKEWHEEAERAGLSVPTSTVCCYPAEHHFIASHAALLTEALKDSPDRSNTRILFSAHGLPKRVVEGGDPYQAQIEYTSRAVVDCASLSEADWKVSYQSRVGPLEWIGPSTDACIEEAGREGKGLVVVPIAFVSEHSETLVELDIEYKKLAEHHGVPWYVRVPALGTQSDYIASLKTVTLAALASNTGLSPAQGFEGCGAEHDGCPFRHNKAF